MQNLYRVFKPNYLICRHNKIIQFTDYPQSDIILISKIDIKEMP